jgi:hypothetical protein
MLPTGKKGIGSVSSRSWRAWLRLSQIMTVRVVTLLAAGGCGIAAAQDFSAGKTAAQLFASDCSACHKSPAGLAKGRDARSLASFLKEHYTTKQDSAAALAGYLAGAPGAGAAEAKPQTPATGPKPKTAARGEAEPEAKPEPRAERPKPRANAAAEPGARPEGEGDTAIMREERRPPREATRTEPDPTVGKLKLYGAAGTGAREIERSADKSHKVESYVNSGSPAETAAPADTGSTNAAAAPGADDHAAKRKKKDAAAPPASDAAHAPRPHRAQAPVIQPAPGNN